MYSQDSKGDNAIAVCKFFLQGYTWYVLEADKNGDDYEFYGIIVGQFAELSYFTLSQLKNVRGKWGLGVERDRGFNPTKVKELNLPLEY